MKHSHVQTHTALQRSTKTTDNRHFISTVH